MKIKGTTWLAIIVALFILGFIIWAIVAQIKERHLQDDPMLKELHNTLKPIFSADNYYTEPLTALNDRDILNEIDIYHGKKSFTINKRKVYICLKQPDQSYYTKHTLIYVMLHEIAHVICTSVGHTEEFHQIFEALLKLAEEKGIYDPTTEIPQDYCSTGDGELGDEDTDDI